ncbi:methionine--tRNA ligase [bacterium]|nr:methionine--tRNA ligase [bacterium]
MKPFYVTTPIYYVNDIPHIGHAYTTIAADVLNRYHRAVGRDTFFLTGVDEHGQKVEQAARQRGISAKQHCDEMYQPFQELWRRLNIKPSAFIRTTDADHELVVQKAMQRLYDQGLIVKRTYEGWYSTSSERFWMEKDLVDGKDPDTGQTVEWISESNYFFLMSRFKEQLIGHLRTHPTFIRPKSRYNEILGFLNRELDDLCISRPKNRLSWGVELPFDRDYVTYVWFDALLNYVSALGYLKDDSTNLRFWPANFQLMGKDILTTHAVYWITMLFALGLEPPRHIFAHGWWTVEGRKMSKSLKNVVDPHILIDTYGPDIVRYFLLREVPFGQDGDFSHAAIISRINADLGNDLGNALNRSVALAARSFEGKVPAPSGDPTPEDQELANKALAISAKLGTYFDDYDEADETNSKNILQFSSALEEIWTFIRFINKYIDQQAPWQLAKEDKRERLATVLYNCLEALRYAAVMLAPFMPDKSEQLLTIIGLKPTCKEQGDLIPQELMWSTLQQWGGLTSGLIVKQGEILFPRIEPEHIKTLLREILTQAENEDKALKLFMDIFPRYKPGKAQSLIQEIMTPDSVTKTGPPESSSSTSQKMAKSALPGPDRELEYETFARVELRTAEVKSAERVKKSNKLIRLVIDLGDEERQIVAGIGLAYTPEELIGTKIVVVANLKPATLMGVESKGMLLAASDDQDNIYLLQVDPSTPPGLRIK